MISHITDTGAVELQNMDGTYVTGMVNGSHLKPYYDGHDMLGQGCVAWGKKRERSEKGNCFVTHLKQKTGKSHK